MRHSRCVGLEPGMRRAGTPRRCPLMSSRIGNSRSKWPKAYGLDWVRGVSRCIGLRAPPNRAAPPSAGAIAAGAVWPATLTTSMPPPAQAPTSR
jgi:hypothetical protein